MTSDTKPPRPPTEAELARLADGTLPAAERERVRAQVAASPQLSAVVAGQARAVSVLRAVDVAAPASLRARTEQLAGAEPRPAGPAGRLRTAIAPRRVRFIPAATALAVAVVAVIVLTGGSGPPTVGQTARLALASATAPAPAPDSADRTLLDLRASGIPFPRYVRGERWEANGTRTDTVRGRRIVTVFYRADGVGRVGYAIVAGRSLPTPSGPTITRNGVRYALGRVGDARLVTWQRAGHTCVIAGRGVGDRTLLALATADEHVTVS
ncbi:MAG: hypothetical protein JOZ07_03760 [Solirubrobacterales bacterium]|nr:hypothetical protein [Solirubrobacterales bacterium]